MQPLASNPPVQEPRAFPLRLQEPAGPAPQAVRPFPFASELKTFEVETEKKGFALRPLQTDAEKRAEALATAQQFEKVFVQELLAGLRKSAEMTGEGGGLFGDGPGADTYSQWFDDSLAEEMVRHGRLGVSEKIMEEFERWKQVPPAPPREPRAHELETIATGGIHVFA